ncbi:hypothetical protein RRG08_022251 [Elysia crispata]|uniref:Uncharacterized protein n=1 Tax=Elysia crispata TaxID=231223 RepID=A0AAE0ZQ91_9GAST|nr:hypothetical protein RRG08_022251 [Elysia crispata]
MLTTCTQIGLETSLAEARRQYLPHFLVPPFRSSLKWSQLDQDDVCEERAMLRRVTRVTAGAAPGGQAPVEIVLQMGKTTNSDDMSANQNQNGSYRQVTSERGMGESGNDS